MNPGSLGSKAEENPTVVDGADVKDLKHPMHQSSVAES